MVQFANRVLFVGFGAVARCTLPIFIKRLSVDPKRITIIDALRIAWLRLPAAIAHPHHDRRNHRRRGYSGRAGDGAPLPIVVVRNRSRYRGVAPPGTAPERYHDAGSYLGRRRVHVDGREPAPGAVRAGRPAP